jgi:hypothetical protein
MDYIYIDDDSIDDINDNNNDNNNINDNINDNIDNDPRFQKQLKYFLNRNSPTLISILDQYGYNRDANSRVFTSEDVYNFAGYCNSTSLTAALTISSNRSNWYTDGGGYNAFGTTGSYNGGGGGGGNYNFNGSYGGDGAKGGTGSYSGGGGGGGGGENGVSGGNAGAGGGNGGGGSYSGGGGGGGGAGGDQSGAGGSGVVILRYLTSAGTIASHLREIPCLIFANLYEENIINELTSQQLVALFSCFTNVTVSEEFKDVVPKSKDSSIQTIITKISQLYLEYQDKELKYNINSGVDYNIHYDLINYVLEWCNCSDVNECKLLLQKLSVEKELFLGEFVKALLKINNISNEMEKISELMGNISFLSKLREIPNMILKYVVTNQSLYV